MSTLGTGAQVTPRQRNAISTGGGYDEALEISATQQEGSASEREGLVESRSKPRSKSDHALTAAL